jgi:hypothetical protein
MVTGEAGWTSSKSRYLHTFLVKPNSSKRFYNFLRQPRSPSLFKRCSVPRESFRVLQNPNAAAVVAVKTAIG